MRRKKDKKAPKGLNRKKDLKKGEVYQVTNDVEVADVDGDEVQDVVFTHEILRDGNVVVQSKTTWFGLGQDIADAFVAALEDVGVTDGETVEVVGFKKVVRDWRKLTKALGKLNDIGDAAADAIGDE